jgi:single-strand DNA-binding protein
MNSVSLIGRLVRAPELRFVPGSGTAVTGFTLAIDKGLTKEKRQELENQGRPTADFVRVVVWGKQAENASIYLDKGKLVGVQGTIQTSTYKTAGGENRYTTEVLANRIEYLERSEKKTESLDDYKFEQTGFEDFQQVDDDNVPF